MQFQSILLQFSAFFVGNRQGSESDTEVSPGAEFEKLLQAAVEELILWQLYGNDFPGQSWGQGHVCGFLDVFSGFVSLIILWFVF